MPEALREPQAVHLTGANPLAPAALEVPSDLNELDAHVWSRNANRAEDGAVSIAGADVRVLAEQFGTPLYIVDESDARARASETVAAFTDAFAPLGVSAKVYYAGKAFLSADVVRWMLEAGCAIDVCSEGELALALAAGAPPALIGFHGNNKSNREIGLAVAAGIGGIVLDSTQELDRVAAAAAAAGVRQPVRVRVNSGVHASTHEFLATSREDQKFGIPLDEVEAFVARIREHHSLEFLGLHSHIGSQIFDADGFGEAADRLVAVHARLLAGGPVPELNLGGGYGIAYLPRETPTDIRTMAAHIASHVADACSRLGIAVPNMAFEPGRTIIGPAGTALYEVGTTKNVRVPLDAGGSADRLYVSVDGGMSDNVRAALYEAEYSVRLASRASAAGPALVRVVGKHCESGDIVVLADYLPSDVAPGDLVAVPATGAYCWSLSSNYNMIGRPAVVAVRDGETRTLIRAETVTDLLARDAGLAAAVTDERP
ncbi:MULTISPECIES: diaminopimelate decarboxylase [unclassified Pseudoclavibacter]|uniref:diaminopimelate decarboxylase n=1 Tax=unclassified Pseudoclavibacter TaxID=2615177 RepID=UPI0027DDACA4|nr:diaminopimelate decarboxylase [Pseudoclavibacter sp. Marseille-Q4354]